MTSENGLDSNFRYVVMAARRARQLQNGSQPLIDSRSNKACRVAQEEIAAGKVTGKYGGSAGPRPWSSAAARAEPDQSGSGLNAEATSCNEAPVRTTFASTSRRGCQGPALAGP